MAANPTVGDVFESMSVIIPAYHAPDEVVATIGAVRTWMHEAGLEHEIIVVDDGSTDDTADRAEAVDGVKVLRCERNRGKGNAVRWGMRESRCAWALFMDVDNSTTIDHLERCVAVAGEADVIIGSRRTDGARIVRRQPLHRRVLGNAFPYLVRTIALPGLSDTQCGFKVFRRNAVETIFRDQRVERFAFDVEILLLARRHGHPIREIPVDWDNPTESTVRVRIDTLQMFWDVLKSTLRLRRGRPVRAASG